MSGTPTDGARGEPSLAYSAVPDQAANRPASGGPAPTGRPPASTQPSSKKDSQPVTTASASRATAGGTADEMNWNAVIAFVLSAIGLLSPVGIWLGYKTRRTIDKTHQMGREFATGAIIIGWLWVAFLVLGILAYLWILI
ncbi:DUF4190 domain-containing protein [Gordonia neofelifaecis]|uniref:DUF4190 domain-containing protein n=1 Tax=Gordonia neofelifaecis NRRL B-59395 TaxID=644548 RepID=F1YLB3_9ACTN|nr:DUF4190 domain-containing protein [Gordonia neofelifaecis]EGD54573.1 hypothetical protein SCNU_13363 [Gordonia neofelifaecis NRRL B-59395]